MADIRELVMRLKVQLESGQIAQAKSEIDTLAQSFEAGAIKGTTAYAGVNTALGGVVSTTGAAKLETANLAEGISTAGTKGTTVMGTMNNMLSQTGGFLNTLATGFVALVLPNTIMEVLSGIVGYMKESVAAFMEEETAVAKLRGTLSGVTEDYKGVADSVNAWALGAAYNSLNSEEDIIESFQKMISLGAGVAQSYDLVSIAIDVAAARGKDLTSVSEAIGKAYEGNYTALRRLVPSIGEAVDAGASFNEILDELGKYSGAAAKSMDGVVGSVQRTKVAMRELQEAVGEIEQGFISSFDLAKISAYNAVGLGDTNSRMAELSIKIADAELATKEMTDAMGGASELTKAAVLEGMKYTGVTANLAEMKEEYKRLQGEIDITTRLQEAGFNAEKVTEYTAAWNSGVAGARDRIEEAVREQEAYNDSVAMAQAEINKIGDTWDDAGMAAGSAGKSVEEIAAATEATSQASREWFQTMQDIRGVATSISEEQLKYAELTGGDVAGAQQGVLDSIEAQLAGQQAIVAELEAKKAAQGLSLEEEKKLQSATLEVWKLMNDQVGKQNDFTGEVSKTVEETKKQEEASKSALAILESSLKVQEMGVQAAIDAAAADEEHLHTLEEMDAAQQDSLETMQAQAAIDLAAAAQAHLQELEKIDAVQQDTLETMQTQAAIDFVAADQAHLHELEKITLEHQNQMELIVQQGAIQMALDAQQNAAKIAQIRAESAAKLQQIALEAEAAERLTVLTSQREVYEMKVKSALDAQLSVLNAMIANKAPAIGSGVGGAYTAEDLKKMSMFEAAVLAASGATFTSDLMIGSGPGEKSVYDRLLEYLRMIQETTPTIPPNEPIAPPPLIPPPPPPLEPVPIIPIPIIPPTVPIPPITPTPIVPPGGYGNTIYQTNNITVSGAGDPGAVFDEINKRIQELTGSAVSGLRA